MRWDEWKALERMTDNRRQQYRGRSVHAGGPVTLVRINNNKFRLTSGYLEREFSNTDGINLDDRLILRDLYDEWYRKVIDNLPF